MRPKMRLIAFALSALLAASCAAPPGAPSRGLLGGLFGDEAIIAGDIMRYGFPGTESLRYRKGYVLSYDTARRVPRWVAERLDPKSFADDRSRDDREFRIDESLPPHIRVHSADFANSGFVRCRLAAAANHRGDPDAFRSTYLLSNVAPQLGAGFRKPVWVGLEQRIRDWTLEADDLLVITGTLFVPAPGKRVVRYPLIGDTRIGVPTHFYKVLLRESEGSRAMLAFVVPHRPFEGEVDYADFLVTVDELEELAGLDFFPDLEQPQQSELEAAETKDLWPASKG